MSFHFKIRDRLLVAPVLVVTVVLGSLWLILDKRFVEWRTKSHQENLVRNAHLVDVALRQRTAELSAQATLLAERLSVALPGIGPFPLPSAPYAFAGLCLELSQRTPSPLFIVTDAKGRVLFDAYQLPENLLALRQKRPLDFEACRRDAATPPLSAAPWPNITAALEGRTLRGVFIYGMDFIPKALLDRRLAFQSVTEPLVPSPGSPAAGALVLGFPLDDTFAGAMKDLAGVDFVVEVGGRVMSSTWGETATSALEELLAGAAAQADANASLSTGDPSYPVHWQKEDYDAVFFPLQDPRGIRIGHYVLFQERPPASTAQAVFRRTLLVVALTGLFTALLLGWWLSRPITSALGDLRKAVDSNRPADHLPELTDVPDEVSDLAGSFKRMVSRLTDQERARHIFGRKVSPEVSRRILDAPEEWAVRGEKRRCTVLFARVTGFPPIDEDTQPDRWMMELNECLETLGTAALDLQGTLDHYGNGTVKALWGAPVRQDFPEKLALQAAFAMREAVQHLNARRTAQGVAPLQLRIGLHTGTMLAGYLGADQDPDYTVLGTEAEKPEDLARKAMPDQILASESVAKALSGSLVFRRLEIPGTEPLFEAVGWEK